MLDQLRSPSQVLCHTVPGVCQSVGQATVTRDAGRLGYPIAFGPTELLRYLDHGAEGESKDLASVPPRINCPAIRVIASLRQRG